MSPREGRRPDEDRSKPRPRAHRRCTAAPMVPEPNKETDSKIELTPCRGGGRSARIGAADLLAARQPRGRGPRAVQRQRRHRPRPPRRRRAARTGTPGRKSHDERLCRAAAGVAARPSIRPGATRFKVVRRAAARGREAVRVRRTSSSAGCRGRRASAAPRESVAPRGVLAAAAPRGAARGAGALHTQRS